MATQTRVPGAASSEVDFELERFERTAEDRIEISGRWYGLRGRRFVRPVLNLNAGGSRRRAIALLEHKPWAAEDGQVWLAAFRWPDGTGDVSGAELEVGPGLLVELPAMGGEAGAAAVRVSALRPHVPSVPPWRESEVAEGDEAAGAERSGDSSSRAAPDSSDPGSSGRADRDSSGRGAPDSPARGSSARPGRQPAGRAAAPEWTAAPPREPSGRAGRESGGRAAPEWTAAPPREPSGRAGRESSARASAPDRTAAPPREPSARAAPPPRDVVTALTAERDDAIAARDKAEQERVTALQDRDDALSRRDAALRDVDRAVIERDEAVAERERLSTALERVTRERDIAHAERSRTLQDSEAIARERDQAAAERDAARSELSRALPARDEAIRERDSHAARADQAERERDTAFAERKSAVAQRDRARRERDRAMRAAGVDPPEESPYVSPAALRGGTGAPSAEPDPVGDETVQWDVVESAGDDPPEPRPVAPDPADTAAATPPGTPLPSRPVKRIGAGPVGPAPEAKPLLTPVDAGRPRRLSRTRRPPSASARWAVRITVMLLMIAIAIVLVMLLGRAL
jgi:hypothetical protein